MFENIIGQKLVVDELKRAIEINSLPGSLLFSGEHYSGKMTTALELARVVSCTGGKTWNCSCRSCKNHRLLIYPYLQIMGNTSFTEEISLCAEILKKKQELFAIYMFIRSVRKLLKRFDPILWDGSESRYKQVVGNAVRAEELIREISPEKKINADKNKYNKKIDRIVDECKKVADSLNSDNIPIDQIRRISSWVHTASDFKKIVIFENADAMNESSRNSLLKLLEEPPKNCIFILITRRKGAIIPTILSRVRSFHFYDRSTQESMQVIQRIFREEPENFKNIKEFFYSKKTDLINIKKLAEDFIKIIKCNDNRIQSLKEIGDFKPLYNNKQSFVLFIEESLEVLKEEIKTGFDHEAAFKLGHFLNEALTRRNSYNQSTQLVLEALLYQAKRIKK